MAKYKINLPNGKTGTISGPDLDEMSAAITEILIELAAETGSHILEFGDDGAGEIARRLRTRGFDLNTGKRTLD